jgi:hypothetical protein
MAYLIYLKNLLHPQHQLKVRSVLIPRYHRQHTRYPRYSQNLQITRVQLEIKVKATPILPPDVTHIERKEHNFPCHCEKRPPTDQPVHILIFQLKCTRNKAKYYFRKFYNLFVFRHYVCARYVLLMKMLSELNI